MPINGVAYDHESLEMGLPGVGTVVTLSDVNYAPTKEVEVKNDKNGVPHRIVRKGFKSDFDCTMARTEFNALAESTGETGVLGADPLAITLTYGYDGDEPVDDELEVKIEKVELGSKEDDEATAKLSGKLTQIPKLAGHDAYVVPGGS